MATDAGIQRLVEAIDRLLARETQISEEHAKILSDHEKRIRMLERIGSYGVAAASLVLWYFRH